MGSGVALPEGRLGQLVAIAITLAAVALLWLAAIAPMIDWYEVRQASLAEQRALAAHMAALSAELPALRRQVAANVAKISGDGALLAGDSDAIAGANLQTAVQDLASSTGTSLDSAGMLPAQQAGALRRIAMQVNVTATWSALVALLAAIETAHPRMIVDGLSVTSPAQADLRQDLPVQASFSIAAFRVGDAP